MRPGGPPDRPWAREPPEISGPAGHCHPRPQAIYPWNRPFQASHDEQLRKVLFGADTPRAFNREALTNGLSCEGRTDRIRSLDKMGEHEFGWLSAFRLLAEKELVRHTFSGTPGSTDPADPSTQLVRLDGMRTGCHNPVGFNFKAILSVFLPGQLPATAAAPDRPTAEFLTGAGGLGPGTVVREHDDGFRKDDMTLETFFNRAATILEIDARDQDHLMTFLDPAATGQPRSLLCDPLAGMGDDKVSIRKRIPGRAPR